MSFSHSRSSKGLGEPGNSTFDSFRVAVQELLYGRKTADAALRR